MGGGASHFNDVLPLSSNEIPHTRYRDEDRDVTDALPSDFYSSTFFADRMIQYLDEQQNQAPFFAYLAFTSPHDPLQVPDAWLNRYQGRYDDGCDAVRAGRLARMKQMGLIDEGLAANPGSGLFPAWDALSEEERKSQARKMEIYAAMIENVDHELGRVIDALEAQGKLDDTLIIFMSDNGANPKNRISIRPTRKSRLRAISTTAWSTWARRDRSFRSAGHGRKWRTRRCRISSSPPTKAVPKRH